MAQNDRTSFKLKDGPVSLFGNGSATKGGDGGE